MIKEIDFLLGERDRLVRSIQGYSMNTGFDVYNYQAMLHAYRTLNELIKDSSSAADQTEDDLPKPSQTTIKVKESYDEELGDILIVDATNKPAHISWQDIVKVLKNFKVVKL